MEQHKKDTTFWADLYACGNEGMPACIQCRNKDYRLVTVFKHDFFAATGLYELDDNIISSGHPHRIVLKISRIRSFCGIPLAWLGKWLCRRETSILQHLIEIDHIPKLLGTWKNCGFIYAYIEGCALDVEPALPDDFFDTLAGLILRIHQKNVIYLDFNKRGNILLTAEGKPALIDFQISLHFPSKGMFSRFFNWVHQLLQNEDRYHLLKHKKKLRPDLTTPSEIRLVQRKSILIRMHRLLTWPYKIIRRWMMKWLYKNQLLNLNHQADCSPENNPHRYANNKPINYYEQYHRTHI